MSRGTCPPDSLISNCCRMSRIAAIHTYFSEHFQHFKQSGSARDLLAAGDGLRADEFDGLSAAFRDDQDRTHVIML